MASTYKWSNAADIVRSAGIRGQENLHVACDMANGYIWRAFAWRTSLADLPPFWLIPKRQDYGPPLSAVPSDFDYLYEAAVMRLHEAGDKAAKVADLKVHARLTPSRVTAWPPEAISYDPETGVFRMAFPTPETYGPPFYFVSGTYKKKPTKLTAANLMSTTIPWDDKYFDAIVETVRWKAYKLVGDQRAGSVQALVNGANQYTGQAGIVAEALRSMWADEERGQGTEQLAPEKSLTGW